ncbi:MAG: AAA family ATPase, partial [Spirochaetales bacterium]|nr:AAA family ATPase [Spirochaetales bacterium]
DAALYWLARMVSAGEDPKYIFRRMLISASEDIGLADPHAIAHTEAAVSAFERVGMPEGRFHLAQAALYLASAPKSNSTMGFFSALKQIDEDPHREVPNHLKDASRDSEGFGHGKGYQYPHAFQDHWVAQQYLPEGLQGNSFYIPSDQGYEKQIKTAVARHKEAQIEAGSADSSPEILTFSPPDSQKDQWLQRLITERGKHYQQIRNTLFDALRLLRHHTVLIMEQGSGMLVWEALRQTPEGGVSVILENAKQKNQLLSYARSLSDVERPVILPYSLIKSPFLQESKQLFDRFAGFNIFTRFTDAERVTAASQLFAAAAEGAILACCETIPKDCRKLSSLCTKKPNRELLMNIEKKIYTDMSSSMMSIDPESLKKLLVSAGFIKVTIQNSLMNEKRLLKKNDIQRWIEASYIPFAENEQVQSQLLEISSALTAQYDNTVVDWTVSRSFLIGEKAS